MAADKMSTSDSWKVTSSLFKWKPAQLLIPMNILCEFVQTRGQGLDQHGRLWKASVVISLRTSLLGEETRHVLRWKRLELLPGSHKLFAL